MIETWLKPNRRALALGMLLPAGVATVGLALLCGLFPSAGPVVRIAGALMVLGGTAMVGALAWQMRIPRIAHERGELLFYLRRQKPLRVPIDHVLIGGALAADASSAGAAFGSDHLPLLATLRLLRP